MSEKVIPEIEYWTPEGDKIGFRGISILEGIPYARIIPFVTVNQHGRQDTFWQGLDVLATNLPYLPDMGPDSEFKKTGDWHHYKGTIFMVTRRALSERGSHQIFIAGDFEKGGKRILLDWREQKIAEEVITPDESYAIQARARELGYSV